MSETANPEVPPEILEEIAKAAEFFKNAGVKMPCPVCSTEDWIFLTAGPGQSMRPGMPMVLQPPQSPFLATAPLVAFFCNNCGFIRSHLRQKVFPNEQ